MSSPLLPYYEKKERPDHFVKMFLPNPVIFEYTHEPWRALGTPVPYAIPDKRHAAERRGGREGCSAEKVKLISQVIKPIAEYRDS